MPHCKILRHMPQMHHQNHHMTGTPIDCSCIICSSIVENDEVVTVEDFMHVANTLGKSWIALWNFVNIYNTIALAGYLLGLPRQSGAELSVWGLRGLMQQIAYHITVSCLIVFFSILYKGAHDSRGPSSCMIVGSSISYHSMKQCRILRESLNKFPAEAIVC